MALIVQKYGGSSVADPVCIRRVAKRIFMSRKKGHSVVVVVSAMGDATDDLIELAAKVADAPSDREMDMLLSTGEQVSAALLAMALHSLGADAVSLTGPQAGISTDAMHGKAKIMGIKPRRVLKHLKEGRVVIVTGFQGLAPSEDVATLGRGGSDATAVALAVVLKADRCQIFTDVDGVYSADPRVVKDARKLDEIAYDEMLELASLGARVLMSRSVEFGKKYGVELEVLSSFTMAPGTVVRRKVKRMEDIVVRGVSVDKEQAKVTISGLPDKPGVAARLFGELAGKGINIDVIVQNVGDHGRAVISFTTAADDMSKMKKVISEVASKMGVKEIEIDRDVAKVSIVGVGMQGHSGVAFRMFKTLAENHINIMMISTSEIKVSVIIRKKFADKSMIALHKAFGLNRKAGASGKQRRARSA